MALGGGNKTLTITTKFEADASGFMQEVSRIVKEVEKAKDKTEEFEAGWLGFSKSMVDGAKAATTAMAVLNQAWEFASKAVAFARESIKGWGEDLRMEAANAGRSIDRLAQAAQGLVNDDALNKFAARAGSGALKLTQGQLETVAQAAVALRERGFEAQQALDALTEAAVTGSTRGLRPLGLEVEEGNSKFETAKNLMAELNKVIAESHGPVSQQADDIERLSVAWDNAVDSAKNYAAQAILAATASTGFDAASAELRRRSFMFTISEFTSGPEFQRGQAMLQGARLRGAFAGGFSRGRAQQEELATIEMPEMDLARGAGERMKMAEAAASRAAQRILDSAIREVERNTGSVMRGGLGSVASSTMRDEFGNDIEGRVARDIINRTGAEADEVTSRATRFAESATRRNETFLESMFGPIDEFDAYATAFGTLQTATQSAMSAWISGSMSLGTAIKKGIGDALGALASQLAVESLKHGAYAVGSLAFGDLAGAGKHGAAAAAFGLGAVAAATAAKKLGGAVAAEAAAQKADAAGGAGVAGTAGGGAGSAGPPREVIREKTFVVYADPFAEGTAGTRRRNARKVLDRAKGGDNWEDN